MTINDILINLDMAKQMLDTISVSGIENQKKIPAVYDTISNVIDGIIELAQVKPEESTEEVKEE